MRMLKTIHILLLGTAIGAIAFGSSTMAGELAQADMIVAPADLIRVPTQAEYYKLQPQHIFGIRSIHKGNNNSWINADGALVSINISSLLPLRKTTYSLNSNNLSSFFSTLRKKSQSGADYFFWTNYKKWNDGTNLAERFGSTHITGIGWLLKTNSTVTPYKYIVEERGSDFIIREPSGRQHSWFSSSYSWVYTDGGAIYDANKFEIYRLNTNYPNPVAYYSFDDVNEICNEFYPTPIECSPSKASVSSSSQSPFGEGRSLTFNTSSAYVNIPSHSLSTISSNTGEYTLSFWLLQNAHPVQQKSTNPLDWRSIITFEAERLNNSITDKVGIAGAATNMSTAYTTLGKALSFAKASKHSSGKPVDWIRPLQSPISLPLVGWAHIVVVQKKNEMYIYANSENIDYGNLSKCKYNYTHTGIQGKAWPIVYYDNNTPKFMCSIPHANELVGQQIPFPSPFRVDKQVEVGIGGVTNIRLGSRQFYDHIQQKSVSTTAADQMDELLIFDKALSPQQVRALHADQLLYSFKTTLQRRRATN